MDHAPRLRAIMAVSKDGFFSRGPMDDMSWLGQTDKAVFRILTGVGGLCVASLHTCSLMPTTGGFTGSYMLGNRTIATVSRRGRGASIKGANGTTYMAWGTLQEFTRVHPGAWLLGGPALLTSAMAEDLVDELHLCVSDRMAFAHDAPGAIREHVRDDMVNNLYPGRWENRANTRMLDVMVQLWGRIGTA